MSTSNVNMKVLRSPFTPSIFIRIEEERRETIEESVFSLQTFLTFSSGAFLYFHYWFRDDRTPVKIPTELFDDVVHRTVQYYTLRTYIHSYISTWAYVKKGREKDYRTEPAKDEGVISLEFDVTNARWPSEVVNPGPGRPSGCPVPLSLRYVTVTSSSHSPECPFSSLFVLLSGGPSKIHIYTYTIRAYVDNIYLRTPYRWY